MNSLKLYDLSLDYAKVLDLADSEDYDIEMLQDTLDSIQDEIEIKFENISKLIKNLEGEVEIFKAEEKRLSSRRKTKENQIKWLKNYLLQSLEVTKKSKIQAGTFTVAKQKNQASVQIVDRSKLPSKFLTPQEPVEDKKAILKALKDGEEIEGAVIAPETYHLRIR